MGGAFSTQCRTNPYSQVLRKNTSRSSWPLSFSCTRHPRIQKPRRANLVTTVPTLVRVSIVSCLGYSKSLLTHCPASPPFSFSVCCQPPQPGTPSKMIGRSHHSAAQRPPTASHPVQNENSSLVQPYLTRSLPAVPRLPACSAPATLASSPFLQSPLPPGTLFGRFQSLLCCHLTNEVS